MGQATDTRAAITLTLSEIITCLARGDSERTYIMKSYPPQTMIDLFSNLFADELKEFKIQGVAIEAKTDSVVIKVANKGLLELVMLLNLTGLLKDERFGKFVK